MATSTWLLAEELSPRKALQISFANNKKDTTTILIFAVLSKFNNKENK
jgi:hypothetical protein